MANLAVALDAALARRRALGTPGQIGSRVLADGDGWLATDVVCTSGPCDRSFEEVYDRDTIAVVLAGSFQCRASNGYGLLAAGSVMLGNRGEGYECGHDHGDGDRCVSFRFAPDSLARLAADAGVRRRRAGFRHVRVPPLQATGSLVARCAAGVAGADAIDWGALVPELAIAVMQLDGGVLAACDVPRGAEARVSRVVRRIDADHDHALSLEALAREAGVSVFHFLRTFERVTGVTPHQYLRRARLRSAATRLVTTPDRVVDVALDCGFGDVSNFNRAFRSEFGLSPLQYRAGHARRGQVISP